MWGPGNEVMHRLIYPTVVQGNKDPAREKRADDFAAFYVELIDMVRSLDPRHPVGEDRTGGGWRSVRECAASR